MSESNGCEHTCCDRLGVHDHVLSPEQCEQYDCIAMTEMRRRFDEGGWTDLGITPPEAIIRNVRSSVFP